MKLHIALILLLLCVIMAACSGGNQQAEPTPTFDGSCYEGDC